MTDETNMTPETPADTPAPTPAPEKSKRQMTFSVLDDGTIRAEFGEGVEPLTLNPASVPESLQAAAMVEGLISRSRGYTSKLQDADRTPENLRAAVGKAFTNLLAGIWKIERAAGEGGTEYTIEQEAAFRFKVSRAKAKGEEYTGTLAEAASAYSALTDDTVGPDGKKIPGEKSQLKALPRFQLAYQAVKAERAAAKLAALQKKIDAEEADEAPM